ncbi:MAG: tetratricopeptide repeat protein [Verrucomicrobiota bacterium]
MEALLAADSQAEQFPPKGNATANASLKLGMPAASDDDVVGQTIGRYKLLEKVGEGGCGVVYVAQQNEPVRRRVALKVIKLGMDTKEVIARFEAERQALAMMDHPNIAKVLDAGTTETGRPYFVMELVRGIKITEYCDQNQLSTKERLDLFIKICQAIQHAHQKGIIHRDIKPSNILVTLHDGVPVPKVIDFGIAKATEGRLTDETVYTQLHQFIGTPAYMSPEQAEMSGLDIDTRSDIYSLGVLLYELLAGSTPFDAKELVSCGLDAMRKIIREQEPVRPSTRFATLPGADLTTTAKRRSTDTSRLLHQLRGDLDWIVMKCLEKDRTRRYETANGLAMDILRHLQNELVVARPPSVGYRMQKLARRHKLAFAATAAVAAALLMGLGLSTWQYLEKSRAYQRAVAAEQAQRGLRQAAEAAQASETRLRQQAESDRKTAQIEAERSKQVARFLEEMLQGVGPSVALGRDTTILREILDKATDRVSVELTNQPLVEAELLYNIGAIYLDLHQDEKAEHNLRKALAIQRPLLRNENQAVANSLGALAISLYDQENWTEAEPLLREELAINKKLHGGEGVQVARSLNGLAIVLMGSGRLSESEAMYRDALAMERKFQDSGVGDTLHNLAMALAREHKTAEAETAFREALALHRQLLGSLHPFTANTLGELGNVLCDQGKWAEAEPLYREALTIRRKIFHSDDYVVTTTLDALINVLVLERKDNEAKQLFNEAHAPIILDQPHDIGFLRLQTEAEAQQCRFTEAIATVRQAIKINPADHELWHWLAVLLVRTGQLDAYRAHCRESVDRFSKSADPNVADRIAKDCLILPDSGANLDTVNTMADTAIAEGQHSADLPFFQFCKGLAEFRQGHFASATNWMGEVLNRLGDQSERDMGAYLVLAMSQFHLQHVEQARAALTAGTETEQKLGKLETGNIGKAWVNWIIAESLLKEAKALIEGNANAGDAFSRTNLIGVVNPEPKENEVEQFLNQTQASVVVSQPHDIGFLRLRAEAEGRHGRFTAAIATVQQAIEIDPTDHELWHWLAVLLVQTGQLDAYRENCRRSVERFGETTDPATAHRIAKDCLILPVSGASSDIIAHLVEISMAEGQNSNNFYAQCCKGLAEYRLNRFASATNWMMRALAYGGSELEFNTQAYMVLAMSQFHLQHIEQARSALAAGTETEQKLGRLDGGDIGTGWIDWIIAESLMREAKALLNGDANTSDHPK